MRDAESNLRDKWLRRLQSIRLRAGTAVTRAIDFTAFSDSAYDAQELEMLSLGKGAWHTLRGHARRWERFERWALPQKGLPADRHDVDEVLLVAGCPKMRALRAAGVQADDPLDRQEIEHDFTSF